MLTTDKEILKEYARTKCLWMGIPSIEVTKKGRTFLTFYSGGTTEQIGNFVGLIMSDDGKNFTDPIAVCQPEPGHRCFDSNLWIDPLGRLWFTWSRCPNDGVFGAICDDPDADELVFGEEFFIGNSVMMNKPIVLSTGEWAFPLAVWNHGVRAIGKEYDSPIEPKGSFMYVTDDQGKTFRKLGYADVEKRSFDEHMLLELKNGVIRMFVRTTYGIGASDSYDGGMHWGRGFDTGYKGPCSRFHIRRLASGRILLINHFGYPGQHRSHLTAMLSEDEGQTFPYKLLLDERKSIAYPDAAIDSEGRIHICYDRERGSLRNKLSDILNCAREFLTCCITEEDIMAGQLVTEGSYLQNVAYKLTEYDGDLVNPFNETELFTTSKYARYLSNQSKDAETIIEEVFDAYEINCINIHNLQAEEFDKLIEEYKRTRELDVLNEIIGLVRSAHSEGEYSEKGIVDELCRYIIEHLEEAVSAESLAKHFHFSTHYIRHIFKKQTGTTVSGFKTSQIIKKAKLLLKMSDSKIIDVAAACGFDNASYFTEVFLKELGVTPKEYRQQNKAN